MCIRINNYDQRINNINPKTSSVCKSIKWKHTYQWVIKTERYYKNGYLYIQYYLAHIFLHEFGYAIWAHHHWHHTIEYLITFSSNVKTKYYVIFRIQFCEGVKLNFELFIAMRDFTLVSCTIVLKLRCRLKLRFACNQ